MAALRLVAPGSRLSLSVLFFVLSVVCLCTTHCANAYYTHQDLIDIKELHEILVSIIFHRAYNIPDEIVRPAGSPWIVVGSRKRHRRWRERKQRRGCRPGVMLNLRKQPHKTPKPKLYLTKFRSLVNISLDIVDDYI